MPELIEWVHSIFLGVYFLNIAIFTLFVALFNQFSLMESILCTFYRIGSFISLSMLL